MPVLTLEFGQGVLLSELSVWGYSEFNANGISQFSLRFATESDRPAGFGTSIGLNPTFSPTNNELPRQSFTYGQTVVARYDEFTANDNFYVSSGDRTSGGLPGGDRVGLSRIAFAVAPIPEPTSFALMGLSLAGLGYRTRR